MILHPIQRHTISVHTFICFVFKWLRILSNRLLISGSQVRILYRPLGGTGFEPPKGVEKGFFHVFGVTVSKANARGAKPHGERK